MDSREYSFEGRKPEIHEDAHVSREATLVGDVTIGADTDVWPGAVLRGDTAPVVVGKGSHVGDNAVVTASTIGEGVRISSGSILDETTVEDECLVGFNATVAEVTVGHQSIVAAGAVTRFGMDIPPESFVYGHPAQTRPLEETNVDAESLFADYRTGRYGNLADGHDELFE